MVMIGLFGCSVVDGDAAAAAAPAGGFHVSFCSLTLAFLSDEFGPYNLTGIYIFQIHFCIDNN